MNAFSTKTARVGLFYVLLCALSLGVAQHWRLAWCVDFRLATLRKLVQDERREPDVLFLGSSRTVRGIRPKLAEEVFAGAQTELKTGLNLATNGTPRHMNALTLEDYLEHHKPPKVVCIEAGDAELLNWPHQLLTNLMTPMDALRVMATSPYFVPLPRDYGAKMKLVESGKGFTLEQRAWRAHWHMELGLKTLGRGPEDIVRTVFNCLANGWNARGSESFWRALRNPNFAFEPPIEERTVQEQIDANGWYHMDPQNEILRLGKTKVLELTAKRSKQEWNAKRRSDIFRGNEVYKGDVYYTDRIAKLCREHDIRLVFYLLPPYREIQLSLDHDSWLESISEVFYPDMDALQEPENYADTGHLSDLGAERYTKALAAYLVR